MIEGGLTLLFMQFEKIYLIALGCGFNAFQRQKLLFVFHLSDLFNRNVAKPTERSLNNNKN
jgi:hypothetical protein